MSTGKVLLGVLAGVAAGALIGVLFAPDKGWNTRKRIIKKGEDYVESLKDKLDEFLNNMSEKIEDVKDEVTDFAEQAKAKSSQPGKDARTAGA